MGSTLLGTVGFVSATCAAACIASILDAVDWDDEEESLTSNNTNPVVLKSGESILTQDNADSLHLYQIMRIEGCSHLDTKLIVGRIEDELLRKVVISRFLDFPS
ncbi:MAG: hypothetical protein HC836_50120 [Richelia sp. RM2_1_2]|nr:hypothetical protein [Richelia sp. RM2_1_2]